MFEHSATGRDSPAKDQRGLTSRSIRRTVAHTPEELVVETPMAQVLVMMVN